MKCPVLMAGTLWLEGAMNSKLCIPRQCSARWSLLRRRYLRSKLSHKSFICPGRAIAHWSSLCSAHPCARHRETPPWAPARLLHWPDVLLKHQTSPKPREEPCKSQLIAVGWPLALLRSLPTFPAHFKVTPGQRVLLPKGAALGHGLLFPQNCLALTMTGRLSEETFALI